MEADRVLGKYRLIAEIARGGMGIVYLALSQGPGGFSKLLVVKELKSELVEDPAFLTMFLDEARLAARLNHPNIVQTNEVGSDGERHFMAMDYLDGRTYERVRRRSKNVPSPALTLPMQIRMFCDVLAGLDYAHNLSDFDGSKLAVVHRDVSPNNVFITFDGHVKVLDFGIAKAADQQHETQAGVLKGKVAYMAPEQARGQKVDARADVFSVGVMLWEAIAGKRLRTGASDEIVKAAGGQEVPRLSESFPNTPRDLDEIVARALANDRDERFTSATDFQNALEQYLAKSGVNPTSRDLSRVVTELFREERAKTNALIDTYVTRARAGASTAERELPVIELAGAASSLATPLPRPSDSFSTQSGAGEGFGTASLVQSAGAQNVETAQRSQQSVLPVARSSSKATLAVIGGVLVVALAIGAYAFGRSGSDSKETGSQPTLPAAAALAPADPIPVSAVAPRSNPEPALAEIEITVKPATATITVDDAQVPGNPFRGRYREDGVMHRIRATAPGYEAATRDVSFDGKVTVELALTRVAPVATRDRRTVPTRTPKRTTTPPVVATPQVTAPPTVTSPPAPKVDPNQISPTGGQKPQRTIDSSNPYKTQ